MQSALESTQQEVNDRFMVLLDEERRFVRKALLQQRNHLCGFVGRFLPVIEQVTKLSRTLCSVLGETHDPERSRRHPLMCSSSCGT